ncbi:VanZ family protein [Prevotella pallens]|uniref:VanZ family protein n=1 Tax=Prevotella pallens TaxID=60133 RepID=UPI0028E55B94|nr:VanZ family protein [Prevotella pallens]
MNKAFSLLRKFPMAIAMTIFILVVSLIPIPETPLSGITLIDKWTHIGLYTVLGMIVAHEYFHNHKPVTPKGMFLGVWLLPSLLGGGIELLQAYCTNGNRSGEWLDFIADIIGSTIALAIGTLLVKFLSKR